MWRSASICIVAAAALAPWARTSPANDARPFTELAWLAGCWQHSGSTTVTDEQWMAPSGGTMIGMSRTVVNGATVAFEYLRIVADDGRLQYIASPSGGEKTVFAEILREARSVTFSNPEHDFPQRIIYRLAEDGSLLARIEGLRAGEFCSVDYPMRRVSCPGAGPKSRPERPER